MKSSAEIRLYGAVLALSTVLLVPAWAARPAAVDTKPTDRGARVFKGRCSGCHGPEGKGQTSLAQAMSLKDLGSAEVQKMTNKELREIISNGKSPMPAYRGQMKPEEITALVLYIRALGRKEKR